MDVKLETLHYVEQSDSISGRFSPKKEPQMLNG